MATLNFEKIYSSTKHQVTAIHFVDGTVDAIVKHGDREVKVTIAGKEYVASDPSDFPFGARVKGFIVDSSVPDDGCTVFYFSKFYPAA